MESTLIVLVKRYNMTKRTFIACGLIFFLVFCLGIGYMFNFFGFFHSRCACAPLASPWELQPNQMFIHDSEGIFSIKYVDITSREFHFFYAFQAPHANALHVTAVSYPAGKSGALIHLAARVQPLGQLGIFTVGVIHISRFSRAGQSIGLQIIPLRANTSWNLVPLKQVRDEQHVDTSRYEIPSDPGQTPQVEFYGPVMQQQVAYFTDIVPGQPASKNPHIFMRIDDPAAVALITQAEYLSIAGSVNFTS